MTDRLVMAERNPRVTLRGERPLMQSVAWCSLCKARVDPWIRLIAESGARCG